MTAQPQRIEAWTDPQSATTLYTCDDGQKHSWIELEVTTIDGTTETARLTRAQCAALHSEVLDETVPRLRNQWQFEQLNKRPANLSALSGTVAAIAAAHKEQDTPTPPTIEEQRAARKRRRERISTAEYALQKATESVGWYGRYAKIAFELGKELNQARALDVGLDLSALEEEHEKVTRWAAMLPEFEAAAAAAEAEVKAAYRWDGYDND